MNKVYIVTKGRYSDYSIYGVFTDKEVAEEQAAQISGEKDWDKGSVEEYDILTEPKMPPGFKSYIVSMDQNGDCDLVEQNEGLGNGVGYAQADYHTKPVTYNGRAFFYISTNKGKEGAVKIVNERRIQLIAENKWPKKGDEYKAVTF